MELHELGVTPQKEKQFREKGIETVEDLISCLPRKYEDCSAYTGILEGNPVSVFSALVADVSMRMSSKQQYVTVKLIPDDEEIKTVQAFFFNCEWRYPELRGYTGRHVTVVGKVEYNPEYDSYSVVPKYFGKEEDCLRIFPIYSPIPKMSSKYFLEKMQLALAKCAANSEMLPDDLIGDGKALPMPTALQYVHAPKSMREAEMGWARIQKNELLYFAVHNELLSQNAALDSPFRFEQYGLSDTIQKALPYCLTQDQRDTVKSILESAKEGKRVNALIQGDVGCGKTIVAVLVSAAAVQNGYQAVVMAPTQVLAKQHYETFDQILRPFGIRVGFLDGSMSAKDKRKALQDIQKGNVDIIVGTQACIAAKVEYHKLGLTIVDEEHRFGVKQRNAIIAKAEEGVHSITMSATPIPRSLAQVLYGQSCSLYSIHTMPMGRKPVKTGIATDQEKVFRYIRSEIRKGHQAYVVCPMIDGCEGQEIDSVESVSERYQLEMEKDGIVIATLTGRNSAEETETVLTDFQDGLIDILISTTVVEVGINVPNATVMVITSADRFGLSALHQLRGRVGRGDAESVCILQTDSTKEKALARLNVLRETNDGFKIAEEDLSQRGAGKLFGSQQSGMNKYINLMLEKPESYEEAKKLARELISRGMDCCPLMRKVAQERMEMTEAQA